MGSYPPVGSFRRPTHHRLRHSLHMSLRVHIYTFFFNQCRAGMEERSNLFTWICTIMRCL